MEELGGEDDYAKALAGEGSPMLSPATYYPIAEVIKENKLSFEEACKCLSMLGKDESGVRYAYLMVIASERKLTDVSTLLNFKHILFLDVSGNFLNFDAIQLVTAMPYLLLLKAERNCIEFAALKPMPYLQVLVLNRNQISETCDIDQPMLESLELHYNLIFTAQFDAERLPCLKQLELRGNHLMDISGTYPPTVEKLYMAMNRIKKIYFEGLSKLVNLTTLHLRDNNIRKLDGFSAHLAHLEYLNLRNNKIVKLRQFWKLKCLPSLNTLIILGNPVHDLPPQFRDNIDEDEEDFVLGEDETSYDTTRIPLLVLLPNLKRINKVVITLMERETALQSKDERLADIMGEVSSEDETEPPTTTDFTTEYTTDTDLPNEEREDSEDND